MINIFLFQTSTERLSYKPVNIIDLTASQLADTPSIHTKVQELEDVLDRRLTLPEIQVNIYNIKNSLVSFCFVPFFSILQIKKEIQ